MTAGNFGSLVHPIGMVRDPLANLGPTAGEAAGVFLPGYVHRDLRWLCCFNCSGLLGDGSGLARNRRDRSQLDEKTLNLALFVRTGRTGDLHTSIVASEKRIRHHFVSLLSNTRDVEDLLAKRIPWRAGVGDRVIPVLGPMSS